MVKEPESEEVDAEKKEEAKPEDEDVPKAEE